MPGSDVIINSCTLDQVDFVVEMNIRVTRCQLTLNVKTVCFILRMFFNDVLSFCSYSEKD